MSVSEEDIGMANRTAASVETTKVVNGSAPTPKRRVRDSLSQLSTGGRNGKAPTALTTRKLGETEPACAQWGAAHAQGIIHDDLQGSPGDELPDQPGPQLRKRPSSVPPLGENRCVCSPFPCYGSRYPQHPAGPLVWVLESWICPCSYRS